MTDSVCSPNRGGRPIRASGVADKLRHRAGRPDGLVGQGRVVDEVPELPVRQLFVGGEVLEGADRGNEQTAVERGRPAAPLWSW